ncbi:MAG: hypothetical protein A2992_08630 [Elusimicrobia bacterium RIFCSPLOWO2_01_FULL_59_12]|nr:MAG: hypothetical protein A2992_08630 [Elusimicrobia bacterium RIFCSPLOWO2_01_FULL_59_12]
MDRTTARLSSRYLSYGLPFLYLLTSIAFYLRTYDSAQVKITIVQMLGTVLVTLWYLKVACEGGVSLKRYAPVVVPLLASLASGLISFSHTAYPGPNLDETLRRVFYVHFALIALTEINTLERLKRMVKYLLLATAISVGYGMIEMLDIRFYPISRFPAGIDPFIWRQAFATRIFSTFGNPNFFGNFLVILTPITLALMLKRNKDRPLALLSFALCVMGVSALLWKIDVLAQAIRMPENEGLLFMLLLGAFTLWSALKFSFLGILFFFITLCNIVTVSKGAWVGYTAAVIGFMMLVLFFFTQLHSERLRRALKIGMFAALAVCSLGVGIVSMQRMDSIRFRIFTWVSTWEMAAPSPIIGSGVGSFRVLYPAYRRPQIFHIEGKHNTETDHAENEYLEVFMDEGLIGFGIFVWIIVLFSTMGARALARFTEGLSIRDPVSGKRKSTDDPRAYYMLGILAAFWGMLIHNFMDVSLRFVSSGIFLWLLAGLIGAMVIHDPMRETEPPPDKDAPPEAAPSPLAATLQKGLHLATLSLSIALAYFIVMQFKDAQGPLPQPFGELLLWLISWIAFAGTVAATLWVFFKTSKSLRLMYGFLIFGAALFPVYTFWGFFMADVHHNRGIFFSKQQKWDEALANYQTVVRLNPNYLMAYYFMGNVYTDRWRQGDYERAVNEYGRTWAIAPNYVQSHHQAGLVHLKKGADDKAAADQARASGQAALANQMLMEVEKDWAKALFYFQKYHDIDPVFEPNYTRMAWVKIQLADLARARGDPALAESYLDKADALYKESLGAWVCGAPENNVMGEDWHRTHRHFTADMFENLGNLRFMRGRFREAAKAFRMATKEMQKNIWVERANPRGWKNLAVTYGRLGDQQNAYRAWLKVRELSPNDPDVQKIFNRA